MSSSSLGKMVTSSCPNSTSTISSSSSSATAGSGSDGADHWISTGKLVSSIRVPSTGVTAGGASEGPVTSGATGDSTLSTGSTGSKNAIGDRTRKSARGSAGGIATV